MSLLHILAYIFKSYVLTAIRMNIIFIPTVLLQQIFEIRIFQPL